ncbi:MAG: 16S rRNA (cytidine(1402)-2'-O)-methyltransferase [Candidatus Borkfalkiaceae bacterium]|nr:16S rRNA (cytidine(1402)-2'-O)-methyltransferase [Clostridia bacterium]MDY6223370.1 16S rRNA (cytidine(1402)-2'-O)-methyltransferase [Christensenellaceae bacterium]
MVSFVATPIGNLGDITFRAVETLKNADEIYCEDTRHTVKLLNAYQIKKPLYSCHKFNERQAAEKIAAAAREGKNVAVVSDAGLPVVSDPGNVVCEVLKERGVPYTVIPGANAALCALILSGLPAERFLFIGFLPEKAGEKRALIERYKDTDATLLFHVAPQDIDGDIRALYETLGERRAAAVREITKIHEESVPFLLSQGLPGEKRGEYVLVVEGAAKAENPLCALSEREHILHYMRLGYDKKEALKKAAKDRGVSKSALYSFSVDL